MEVITQRWQVLSFVFSISLKKLTPKLSLLPDEPVKRWGKDTAGVLWCGTVD